MLFFTATNNKTFSIVNPIADTEITKQESLLLTELRENVNNITATRLVDIDDCPPVEIDPDYERDAIHRVINQNDKISCLLCKKNIA